MINYFTREKIVLFETDTPLNQVSINDEVMLYARWYDYWIHIIPSETEQHIEIEIYPIYNGTVLGEPKYSATITISRNNSIGLFILPYTICDEITLDKFQIQFSTENNIIKKIERSAR